MPLSVTSSYDDESTDERSTLKTAFNDDAQKAKEISLCPLPITSANGLRLIEFNTKIQTSSHKQSSLGLFNKGKSSSQSKKHASVYRVVSDIVFSEQKFLKRDYVKKKKTSHEGRCHKSSKKNKKEKKKNEQIQKGLYQSYRKECDDASTFESIESILTECRRAPQFQSPTIVNVRHSSPYSSQSSVSTISQNSSKKWYLPDPSDPTEQLEGFWKTGIKRCL
ncbi:hypothetical protein BY458DRAFT_494168 [Sporodiniella umbellata]|nr:hypothetical protein BY458DRAFT_494168 [Sporodiniella umbellata]